MSKYLYGASVQGIQEFIFATNKLQEIVGASEMVKNIEKQFEEFVKDYSVEILMKAAGNIKAIFNDKKELREFLLIFSKTIRQKAYGITLSQAVVNIGDSCTQKNIDKLVENLKIQRNKPSIPLDESINIMKLNAKTARPAIANDEDKATIQKREAYAKWFADEKMEDKEFEKSKELSYISNSKNKIAIIHIDGNGLGKIIPKLGDKLSAFSVALNNATIKAVDNAKEGIKDFRKIIVGGDDVTVICNANDALNFTKNFLNNFEESTKNIKELNGIKEKLTACAGIAYCNEKYPFHYAIDLAEALCGVAKNHSKRESSCLMFHNIQSSNYQSWDKFVEDELTIKNDTQTIRCDFGAYYLDKKDEANISDFINTLEAYRCDGSPISRLRNWLSELYKSDTNADNLLKRINSIVKEKDNWNCEIMDKNLKFFHKDLSNKNLLIDKYTKKEKEEIEKDSTKAFKRTPIYDILQILSITDKPKGANS